MKTTKIILDSVDSFITQLLRRVTTRFLRKAISFHHLEHCLILIGIPTYILTKKYYKIEY